MRGAREPFRDDHPLRVVGGNVPGVSSGRFFLALTRVWLPLVIAVAGIVAIVIGHGTNGTAAAGVGLLIVALIVWMVNWMYRMSVASNREREREEAARTYFSVHGRWPDE
jgi:drug/metabolite transporter (DMT)-like permease